MLGVEEEEAVVRVLRSGRLAQGPEVEAFEDECAAFVGRRYGVAVSSGTAALHLALHALGVEADDIVAIPAYACASLLTAVSLQRATAHIVDVNDDFNLDARQVPVDTGYVILPHLFGKRAETPGRGVVIEDVAQSIGGDAGRAGTVAIASFYATKLLTTGEGGMILTDDGSLADVARDRRDYDNRDTFVPRFSYKMSEMQAAMGRVQLRRLTYFLARRRHIAFRYVESLHDLPIGLPDAHDHVFFRFVITTDRQTEVIDWLVGEGVEAKRPVYRPAHHYVTESSSGLRARTNGGYPRADRAHAAAVSLPIHPGMRDEDADAVIEAVRRFFEERPDAA